MLPASTKVLHWWHTMKTPKNVWMNFMIELGITFDLVLFL